MPRVWISLGSNVEPERNLRGAVRALRECYGALVVSPVYESAAVGFAGDPFFNLVVGFDTGDRVRGIHARLRLIEDAFGRVRGGQRFASRTLDLDLLSYGAQVLDDGGLRLPRDEITRYAFVLRPMADVAGEEIHPLEGISYAELWARLAPSAQRLTPVALRLDTE